MAGVEHDERFEAVYGELRAIAASYFRGRSADHTLQPTALVNEVYLKLGHAESKDRAHFLALAATAMRQILIDHARKKNRMRRGGGQQRVTISGRADESDSPLDVLALDEVLERLAAINEVQAKIVELRLFGGLTMAEIAEATTTAPPRSRRKNRARERDIASSGPDFGSASFAEPIRDDGDARAMPSLRYVALDQGGSSTGMLYSRGRKYAP